MKVLITGASGMLGRELVNFLLAGSHTVIAAGRSPPAGISGAAFLEVDFAEPPDAVWWEARLVGIDAVINAVGIFREKGGQTFERIHVRGPVALFKACARRQTGLVIQVSALGSDRGAETAYHRSKFAADEVLRSLDVRSTVVQPSLIYAAEGKSTNFFHRLAVLPLLVLPRSGMVQPVHIRDVVEGVGRLIERRPDGAHTVAFVGPFPLSLRAYLAALRRGLGLPAPVVCITLSDGVFRWLGSAAGWWPGSLLSRDSADMLLRGNTADAGPFERILGHGAKPAGTFIDSGQSSSFRTQAILGWMLPLMNCAVAAVWIWTGLVSLGLYPVTGSLALLREFGLQGSVAIFALYGAAALDFLLGVLTLTARGRLRHWTLISQLLLIATYTAMVSATMPYWWLHPFGPMSKNLPMLAGIALLLAFNKRRS
jgi:uncharacterized protein YbjT (DUF2867 family)